MPQQTVSTLLVPSPLPKPVNPLTHIRLAQGVSDGVWARRHRVNRYVVQLAEAGCYNKPPAFYWNYEFSIDEYQKFRKLSRKWHFPEPPPFKTFKEFYSALGNSDYKMGVALCVQPAEVFRLKTRRIYKMPASFRMAMNEIGADVESLEFSLLMGGN